MCVCVCVCVCLSVCVSVCVCVCMSVVSFGPVLRYGDSVFTKESQDTEFFVLLNYYVNSGQLLNYVYIDICQ